MDANALVYSPQDFASAEFAANCGPCFDRYITQRILGVPRDLAIIDAFDMIAQGASLKNAELLGLAAECNPYVRERFCPLLDSLKASQLWSANRAINALLQIVNGKGKASEKTAAIKELNILIGITVEEDGRTSKVPVLADLYRTEHDHPELIAMFRELEAFRAKYGRPDAPATH